MNALIETVSTAAQASNWSASFIDAALKSGLVLLFAAGLSGLWRGASAAARHWVWFVAMATLLVLPMVSVDPPTRRALWRVSSNLTAGNQVTLAFEFVPGDQPNLPRKDAAASSALASTAATGKTRAGGTQRLAAQLPTRWIAFAATIWFLGVLARLSSIALARMRLRRMKRQAAVPDENATSLLHELCQMLSIKREVLLLQSNEEPMPMTWGILRPVILLPAESSEWSPDRLRLVLLHELAHVKRFDCLAQLVAGIGVAIYWFNPLVWMAARRMCVERERACDDIVTSGGCKPSEYATHLLEIAGSFQHAPRAAAIAMARPSGLAGRIRALLDQRRNHHGVARATAILTALAVLVFALFIGACATSRQRPATPWTLEESEVSEQLRRFVAEKREQAIAGAKAENRAMLPEYKDMFAAAAKGNWTAISNVFEDLRMRAPQYEFKGRKDARLHGTPWQTILEIWGAFANIANGEEKYMVGLARDAIESMQPGSIYFGGTDPGRFLITALSRSHVKADPIFTITQNALADGTYVEYARRMYGDRIYLPTSNDTSQCFDEYMKDVEQRAKANKLKPGEEFKMVNGKAQVSGQVAVMGINALLAKLIFDKNPNTQFYIEESFPLEWMYPHLSPNGPILKLNRKPVELSQEMIQRDHEYWMRILKPMIGGWLSEETPLAEITAFAEKTFRNPPKQDRFVHDDAANKWASKLRSSIAGVYAWHAEKAVDDSAKQRLTRAADFAFRQAYAVCPYSPEAVFRYCNLLVEHKRVGDALLVAQTAVNLEPDNKQMRDLREELKRL
jgi:beta-lactamase regulating signal transducer with metallopeptidase domain